MPVFKKRLQFLQPDPPPVEVLTGQLTEADVRTLRAFGVRPKKVK